MRRALTLGPAELALAAALFAWSLVSLGLLALDVHSHGGVLSGSDGALPGGDQLLYLGWARESGHSVLAADPVDLRGPHNLLQPVYLVSGLLSRTGLDLRVAVWLWKPVAALLLVGAFGAYVREFLTGAGARLVALVVALLYFSPVLPLLDGLGLISAFHRFEFLLVSGELMPAWQLWGYLHAAIAVALLALSVLTAGRAVEERDGATRHRLAAWSGAAALGASWLHPWQGLTLLAILAGALAWGRAAPRVRILAAPLACAALPLAVYGLLSATSRQWDLAAQQNHAIVLPWAYFAGAVAPLAAVSALGVRRPVESVRERMLVLWPLAGFAVYLAVGNARYHAFQGLSLPLAILAVRGWRRLGARPALTAAGVAGAVVVSVSGLAYEIDTLRRSIDGRTAPYALRGDEARALRWLEDSPRPGGVLAPEYLGMAVPSWTGRRTWVGHHAWTPDYQRRRAEAEALFGGALAPPDARRLVAAIRPAFLLADCGHRADLSVALGVAPRRFGCATVYELRREG
jgi:hypothetical protein